MWGCPGPGDAKGPSEVGDQEFKAGPGGLVLLSSSRAQRTVRRGSGRGLGLVKNCPLLPLRRPPPLPAGLGERGASPSKPRHVARRHPWSSVQGPAGGRHPGPRRGERVPSAFPSPARHRVTGRPRTHVAAGVGGGTARAVTDTKEQNWLLDQAGETF